jgi:hypothetical protein
VRRFRARPIAPHPLPAGNPAVELHTQAVTGSLAES